MKTNIEKRLVPLVNQLKVRYNLICYSRGVAQSGSAPRLGRGGRRFESSHPDHQRNFLFKSTIESYGGFSLCKIWLVAEECVGFYVSRRHALFS